MVAFLDSDRSGSLFTKEAVKEIIFSICFGMLLPFGDSGTDLRLGIRLYMNGHPRWAFSILTPVFLNTIYTLFTCRQMEKKETRYWWFYLPLVFLQVYPQYCICRLIYRYLRRKISLAEFVSSRDSLEGGMGCIEPYCESVPQVFIQTAIFAFVHNIDPLLTKLCYKETNPSCLEYDKCDTLLKCSITGKTENNVCDGIGNDPFISGYENFKQMTSCKIVKSNCTEEFDECILTFRNCIDVCKDNLNTYISRFNETELYEMANSPTFCSNNPLTLENGATEEDFKLIQMYLLVIGNYPLFVSTYIISIFAATYGVSKFFRLGHARIHRGMSSPGFIGTATISGVFMLLKGVALAGIVVGNQDPLAESGLWWLLFTMLPTSILVLIWTAGRPFLDIWERRGRIPWLDIMHMTMKQPSVLLAPLITPFVFTMEGTKVSDKVPAKIIKEKNMKTLSCYGTFEWDARATAVNLAMSAVFTVLLLSWRSPWIDNGWKIFGSFIIAAIILCLGFVFWGALLSLEEKNEDDDLFFELDIDQRECVTHQIKECVECIEMYGFYIEEYRFIEACEKHENKKPFELKKPHGWKSCEKCKDINIR